MRKHTAQSSLEYLMIVALTFGIILPTTYLFFQYSSESNTQIKDSQITSIGRSMADTAETVFYSGEGSKIVLEVDMPEGVEEVYIVKNRELVFNVTTEIGRSQNVFFSDVNITSNSCSGNVCYLAGLAGTGLKRIRFQSFNDGDQVLITRDSG